jgi:3-hydroxybutyryl-CoA dehydrogenase
MSDVDRPIAVVGSGTMGRGIAQVAAAAGYATRVVDVDRALVEGAVRAIGESLARRVADKKLEASAREATLARLEVHDDIARAAAGCGIVI